jgi:hypothetical protein
MLVGGGTDADRDIVGGMVPRLAMNASGSALVVWERRTASASSIWANRYDPIQGWSGAESVGSGSEPIAVIDAGGNALLAWLEEEGQRRSIRWRRRVAGSAWSAAARVPVASDQADAFSLAVAPAGDALLVWTAMTGVWVSSYSAVGGWGSPVLLGRQVATGRASAPQVAMDAGGDAAVVWIDYQALAPFGSSSLRGTHLVAGSGWRDAQNIGQGGRLLVATRLEADDAGNALVAWTPVSVMPGVPFFSRLSIASGWQTAQSVSSLGPEVVKQLAMGRDGSAVLVLSPPGVAHGLTASRFEPATSWSPLVSLAVGADQVVATADVDVEPSGNALVVWDQHGSASRATVWTAELSADPRWGTPQTLKAGVATLPQCGPDVGTGGGYSPALRIDASGRALAVWGEFDCERWSIWADRFLPR